MTGISVGALHCLAVTDTGQVYAWGDNDHGQQGNGSTAVNRRPTLVQGMDGVKITRVACGPSHSVAWTAPEPPSTTPPEPVPFPTAEDPLGTSAAGKCIRIPDEFLKFILQFHSVGFNEVGTEANRNVTPAKEGSTSLSRALLSMSSLAAQQRALHYILQALQIQLCRDVIVAAFDQRTAPESAETADGAHQSPIPVISSDLLALIRHKEIAALWELLRLNAAQGDFGTQTRNTLTDVLSSKQLISIKI